MVGWRQSGHGRRTPRRWTLGTELDGTRTRYPLVPGLSHTAAAVRLRLVRRHCSSRWRALVALGVNPPHCLHDSDGDCSGEGEDTADQKQRDADEFSPVPGGCEERAYRCQRAAAYDRVPAHGRQVRRTRAASQTEDDSRHRSGKRDN